MVELRSIVPLKLLFPVILQYAIEKFDLEFQGANKFSTDLFLQSATGPMMVLHYNATY